MQGPGDRAASPRWKRVIGAVVVTHGKLARELLAATERIVGSTEAFIDVALGWEDEVADARQQIRAAIDTVDRGAGVLVFTDMFGDTPTNISLSFLQPGHVEIITGVNLPMLVKLASLQGSDMPLREVARQLRARGQASIQIASEILASPEQA